MPFIKDKITTTNWYGWDDQSWYAWTANADVYYTKSSTPIVGDKVYNSTKQDSGYTVKSISGSVITIG